MSSVAERSWGDACQSHTCFARIPSVTVAQGKQITQSCFTSAVNFGIRLQCEVHSQPYIDVFQNPRIVLRAAVLQSIKLL